MSLLLSLSALAFLFLLSGFFSGTETALFSLSKIERRRLTENHPHLAKRVTFHLEHPRRALITILIGNMVVNTLASAIATLIVYETWGSRWLGLAMAGFTLALILFGEITPKVLAVRKNEALALLSGLALEIFAILFYPIRRAARFISDWILSFLVREKMNQPDLMSEAELKALIKIGEEEGVLDREERYMIQKIFELGERPVKAIMTPRIDLAALNVDDPPEKQIEIIQKYHFSHMPVYKNSKDHILGVISVQDYVLNENRDITAILKQPLFVPETKRIDDLLEEFRRKGQSFAVCVDEHGGTAGIVTQEDILEEIFGEFYDEYAKVENPIRSLGHGEFIVDAKISLADFNEYFSTHLKAGEASTLGGFILEKMGEVPEKGKYVKIPECDIRINDMIRQRIHTVIVRPRI